MRSLVEAGAWTAGGIVGAWTLWHAVVVVQHTENALVERLGRFQRILQPGLAAIIPGLERVAHRVSMLERSNGPVEVSVVTKDNVEVKIVLVVFFRVREADLAVYGIEDVEDAIRTLTTASSRNAGGEMEFDELQRARATLTQRVKGDLAQAGKSWGVEITQTEIEDVVVDEPTREAMRLQLAAERARRAEVARAQGEKKAKELAAEGDRYQAAEHAKALLLTAQAEADAMRARAKGQADQIKTVGEAMAGKGAEAAGFEIERQRLAATAALAGSSNGQVLILPGEALGVLGAAKALAMQWPGTGGRDEAAEEAARTDAASGAGAGKGNAKVE